MTSPAKVGLGLGKAVEVSEAIRKGWGHGETAHGERFIKGRDHFPTRFSADSAEQKVILRPGFARNRYYCRGKTVRAVLESVGVKDILSKSLGSNNPSNVVKATIKGLPADTPP